MEIASPPAVVPIKPPRLAAVGDEVFVRAWRLYLAGSEVGFTTGSLQLFQLTFAREDADLPWTRAALYR